MLFFHRILSCTKCISSFCVQYIFICEELLASSTANQAKFSYRASTDWINLVWSVVNKHLERGFVLTCEGPPSSCPGAGSAILGQSHLSKQWVVPRTGHGIVDGRPLLKEVQHSNLLQLLLTDYRNLLGYGIQNLNLWGQFLFFIYWLPVFQMLVKILLFGFILIK